MNGRPYSRYAAFLDSYPELDGMPVPLSALRRAGREIDLGPVATNHDQPIARYGEQERKAILVVTTGLSTYGDIVAPERQPITLAKFAEPGRYTRADPMRFDLRWLATPTRAVARRVRAVGQQLIEIELTFQNGHRILLSDANIASLTPHAARPTDENDLLRMTFGIGTPEIYASESARTQSLVGKLGGASEPQFPEE